MFLERHLFPHPKGRAVKRNWITRVVFRDHLSLWIQKRHPHGGLLNPYLDGTRVQDQGLSRVLDLDSGLIGKRVRQYGERFVWAKRARGGIAQSDNVWREHTDSHARRAGAQFNAVCVLFEGRDIAQRMPLRLSVCCAATENKQPEKSTRQSHF